MYSHSCGGRAGDCLPILPYCCVAHEKLLTITGKREYEFTAKSLNFFSNFLLLLLLLLLLLVCNFSHWVVLRWVGELPLHCSRIE